MPFSSTLLLSVVVIILLLFKAEESQGTSLGFLQVQGVAGSFVQTREALRRGQGWEAAAAVAQGAAQLPGLWNSVRQTIRLGRAALQGPQALRSYLLARFAGDMLLDTATGRKRADHIEVGDLLWCRPEDNPDGELVLRPVEEKFVRAAPILNVHVGGQVLCTTAEHPFYVASKGWTAAGKWQPGDCLWSRDGQGIPVEGIADSGELMPVYNWRIAE